MQVKRLFSLVIFSVMVLSLAIVPISAQAGEEVLTVYAGRSESLLGPILTQFSEETGVELNILYGDTAGLASQIIEEGANSPADVYISQDGGALGALAQANLLDTLPSDILARVPAQFQSPDGVWVGLSGRARVLVYNPEQVAALGLELPESILDLTDESYRGLVGWSPTNGSFQSNVTAMRELLGDDATVAWLEGMVDNNTLAYSGNTGINQGVIDGEVIFGITNHYYMFRFLADDPEAPIAQHFFPAGDAGSLVNVAGGAVLSSSDQPGLSQRLLLYLLGETAQTYFADSTYEYPMIDGVAINERLRPLSDIEAPDIDLSNLSDLQGTIDMIENSGALDQ
ncbi:MAG: iron ABC transporter substrate-binding protein [Phototrophicaceae bacterium]